MGQDRLVQENTATAYGLWVKNNKDDKTLSQIKQRINLYKRQEKKLCLCKGWKRRNRDTNVALYKEGMDV